LPYKDCSQHQLQGGKEREDGENRKRGKEIERGRKEYEEA
jgi:hypothetical protein